MWFSFETCLFYLYIFHLTKPLKKLYEMCLFCLTSSFPSRDIQILHCALPLFFTSFDYCWIHKTSWLKIDRKSYGVMMPLNRNSKTKDIYTCEKFYLKDVQKMCSIDESEVSLRKRIFNEDWRRSSKILQKFNLISVSFDRIMTQKF